ncbi:MAG: hypothetical protein WA160_15295 [Pseudobdellovibrio sp.]
MNRWLLIFSMLFISLTVSLFATAEYRVFKLQITTVATKQIRQFQSTLDPIQYANIYPLNKGETITYVQTWRCRGSTDHFKPHCVAPAANQNKTPAVSPEIKVNP